MENQRRFQRYGFREPVSFSASGDPSFAGGEGRSFCQGCLSCDVSEGGIRVWSMDFVPLQTSVQLTVKFSAESLVSVQGRVVWVQKLPHSEAYQLGVEFEEGLRRKALVRELRSAGDQAAVY